MVIVNDGDGVKAALLLAIGLEEGDWFGADGEAIGGVFHVATAEDSAGRGAKGGANPKIGIGRVGIVARLFGRADQMVVLAHAMASEILGITARSSPMNCGLMRAAISSTSSWFSGASVVPAAMLVTQEIPRTRISLWRAAMTSGTVDMPTRSAPMVRKE